MKFFLTLIFVSMIAFFAKAQGNLQFNRVVFIEADTTFGCVQGGNCTTEFLVKNIIVPQGKVLKVEAINSGSFPPIGYLMYFNSVPISIPANSGVYTLFPIWLPSGNYTVKIAGGSSPSGS